VGNKATKNEGELTVEKLTQMWPYFRKALYNIVPGKSFCSKCEECMFGFVPKSN
jgi:hypothetical protein